MEARRYLRCMGQPALFSPAGEPIRFRTKKHLALLVYLAVESRHGHRRDRLAEVLWPKVPISEARHSLATALSILRPRLGAEILETTRDQVVLAPGRIALDLDRLAAGDVLGTEVTGKLEVAAFLEGFDIPDAVEFAMWKDRQQARLLPAIKDALTMLINRCRRTGDFRQIEQLADRMLTLDDLSEEAIRAKMEARAFAGDRLTALEVYEAWRRKLKEDLDAVPSEMVEGMAVRLRRRGWERTTLIEIPNVPTDQWRGRPFIGRSREYEAMYEAWESVRKGVAANVLVLGDSGVGKTTLVNRLTTAAGLQGAAISRVQCYDVERELPYATLGNLARGLLDRPGVSATPPDALAELARMVPEIRHRFPSIPQLEEAQGETARIRITEAFLQLIQAIAEEHPVVLVIDDLHLADDASIAVLHLVMRRAAGHQVMAVLIARRGELQLSHHAAHLRENGRAVGLREIEPPPLSFDESNALLTSILSSDEPQPLPAVRRALVRAAGGFPMVMELLVEDWRTAGDRSLALAIDAMTLEIGIGGAPSGVYGEVLDRIVRTLDVTTHSVLNVAAILGHRLNDVHLYSLADLSVGQTMAGMTELVTRRVLRDAGQGLEFVNELVRTSAYVGVPSPLRRLLHGYVADHLLGTSEREGTCPGLEIAWHCMRAGRTAEAVPYLLQGAGDAIRSGAPYAAERALITALPILLGRERVDATLLLVEVLQEQGRWIESLDLLGGLEVENDCLDERRHDLLAFSARARHYLGTSTLKETMDQLPEVLDIIRHSSDTRTRIRAGHTAAYSLASKRDANLARELLDVVNTIPTRPLDIECVGQLALTKGLLLCRSGDLASSVSEISTGLEELRKRGAANSVMAQLHGGLGTLRAQQGRYEEAVPHQEQAISLAKRLGNDGLVTGFTGNLTLYLTRLGRYEELLARAKEVPGWHTSEFTGFPELQITFSIAAAYALLNRKGEALDAINRQECRLPSHVPAWVLQAWSLWKADVLAFAEHWKESLNVGRSALTDHSFTLQSSAFAGAFARWTALITELDGEYLQGRQIIQALADSADAYDAIDALEILCAKAHLDYKTGRASEEDIKEVLLRLKFFPPAVTTQLSCLRILDRLGSADLPQGSWRPRNLL
jgi:DNA-binding SARP family transcriptional activator/tetratricopeptide (TPR) repeat protein